MSAIKELTKDFGCASERQIMDAFQEISNRLDALEKKAHYHSATNDHETCMHKHTCEIYNGVCEYKPDTERSCEQGVDDDFTDSLRRVALKGPNDDECYDVFLNNAAAMIDDLRARLEQAEKENAELKRQLNSEVKP